MRSRAGNFNPLPSCEGRHADKLHEELARLFQSTPLMRGETIELMESDGMTLISIHFPHARGDLNARKQPMRVCEFQSSPLMRGETRGQRFLRARIVISIHSPHARGDNRSNFITMPPIYFNPLPSCEGRHHKPPKIHPDLRQLTQQNHDTPLFGALQAPFCGAEPDIRGAKPTEKP